MKINRLKWTYLAVIMLTLVSCHQKDENTVEFETLTADKSDRLTADATSPMCSISLKLKNATETNGHKGEVINSVVVERLFNQQEISIKTAMERFCEDYINNYKRTMLSLYNHDRTDSTKRAWYEFHYIISAETQQGSKGTIAYLATLDFYEGGAHGTNQLVVMNFDVQTGRLITLSDIFAEGTEVQLNNILLKSLKEKTGLETLEALKEKGYLNAVDIYAPENFIIGDETITFIYNPSEIAPYEMGPTELIIPYTTIEEILKNSFYSFIK